MSIYKMKKRLMILMLPLFVSASAFAETSKESTVVNKDEQRTSRQRIHLGPFEGPAVYAGMGYGLHEMRYTAIEGSQRVDDKAGNVIIGFEYGVPVGENYIVSLGADYSFGKVKFDKIDYLGKGVDTVEAELKNRMSFFASLGYKIMPDLLAYGKVSFQHARGSYLDTYKPLGDLQLGKGTRSFSGFGIAAGIAYTVTPNLENSFEVKYTDYSKVNEFITSGKGNSTEFNAIVKYRL